PTPPSHFLIRPFDVDALTNVHPAASDPQISTAHVASLDTPKVLMRHPTLELSQRLYTWNGWSNFLKLQKVY
ncbi:hypothetical protein B296_00027464, partial [Ensete ventricosum]